MDILKKLTEELGIKLWQTESAVKLIDEGNTIPFISRYRKEATGSLNDEILRSLSERLAYLRGLEDKKTQVLGSIEEQGKLTEELKNQILAAETLVAVDDLYRPYRPKRRTRATMAKEKGLEGLADLIRLQLTKKPLEEEAKAYLSEERGVLTVEEAIAGAGDILAEAVSDEADYRAYIRKITFEEGQLCSERAPVRLSHNEHNTVMPRMRLQDAVQLHRRRLAERPCRKIERQALRRCVRHARKLQRLPEVADQPAGQRPEPVVKEVRLMAVQHIQVLTFVRRSDDERLQAGCGEGESPAAGRRSLARFYPVVVAIEHKEAPFVIKSGQQGKDVAVDFADAGQVAVFPQFIAVAGFHVSEAVLQIIVQRRQIKRLVGQKAVVPGAAAAVAVAEKDDLRMLSGADLFRARKSGADPFVVVAHDNPPQTDSLIDMSAGVKL